MAGVELNPERKILGRGGGNKKESNRSVP